MSEYTVQNELVPRRSEESSYATLRSECREKCKEADLFWDRKTIDLVLNECSDDGPLKRIKSTDLDLGYNKDDPRDKADFFNHLPNDLKIEVVDSVISRYHVCVDKVCSANQSAKTCMSELLEDDSSEDETIDPEVNKIIEFLREWRFTEFKARQAKLDSSHNSVLYGQQKFRLKDIELRPLDANNKDDSGFLTEMPDLPKPKSLDDYNRMQLTRLLPVQTLESLERKKVPTSRHTLEFRK